MSGKPSHIILADTIDGEPANIGEGMGMVPVVGDELRVSDVGGAPMILTVYRRVFDGATGVWHVHVNRTA
jgi:hypothetical protein